MTPFYNTPPGKLFRSTPPAGNENLMVTPGLIEPACVPAIPADNVPMKRTVAIIGASSDRAKFGNKAVRAFQQQGHTVFPVNLKEPEIEGLPAFKSILD